MKILIVDDDLKIQKMLTRRLKKAGYELAIAKNGEESIQKHWEFQPDLTLMDMHMPVMDGYTAVQTLRKRGYTGTIIALTASATTLDIPKAISAGCDYFIPKPIENNFEDQLAEISRKKNRP
ncbi:MAG: response regulator [Desulfamplus sp.]|nr:response regulator [Desulfamplus sp.]